MNANLAVLGFSDLRPSAWAYFAAFMISTLGLTLLSEIIDGPVGLNQDGEEALCEVQLGLVDEDAASHRSVMVSFNPQSVLAGGGCAGNLENERDGRFQRLNR